MSKQKSDITTEFLEKYKELEGVLRDMHDGLRVLDYEQTLPGTEEEKLRLCRQIRNYIQHHDDGNTFISATQEMSYFIQGLIEKERGKEETAKDKLYRLSPLSVKDKLSEAVNRFSKTKRTWMPVTDNGLYKGGMDLQELISLIAGNKLSTTLEKAGAAYKKDVVLLQKQDSIKELLGEKPDCVVVDKNSKYLGVVNWNKKGTK